jgi:hypothetical protein
MYQDAQFSIKMNSTPSNSLSADTAESVNDYENSSIRDISASCAAQMCLFHVCRSILVMMEILSKSTVSLMLPTTISSRSNQYSTKYVQKNICLLADSVRNLTHQLSSFSPLLGSINQATENESILS